MHYHSSGKKYGLYGRFHTDHMARYRSGHARRTTAGTVPVYCGVLPGLCVHRVEDLVNAADNERDLCIDFRQFDPVSVCDPSSDYQDTGRIQPGWSA